jgi:hypothetical protein
VNFSPGFGQAETKSHSVKHFQPLPDSRDEGSCRSAVILLPLPASAGCEKGYEQRARSMIELYYKEELRKVEAKKDLAIKDAFDRYKAEYGVRTQ